MITVKLSEAQRSALECRDWSEEPIMRESWDGGYRLKVDPQYADQLLYEVTEASNAEDAQEQELQGRRDYDSRTAARHAARAARAPSSLGDRIIRSAGFPR